MFVMLIPGGRSGIKYMCWDLIMTKKNLQMRISDFDGKNVPCVFFNITDSISIGFLFHLNVHLFLEHSTDFIKEFSQLRFAMIFTYIFWIPTFLKKKNEKKKSFAKKKKLRN